MKLFTCKENIQAKCISSHALLVTCKENIQVKHVLNHPLLAHVSLENTITLVCSNFFKVCRKKKFTFFEELR